MSTGAFASLPGFLRKLRGVGKTCPRDLALQSLSAYPDAVCNDGSSAAYYFSKGDPTKWLVYLAPGGWCWNEASCRARATKMKALTTSRGLPELRSLTGVFDECRSPAKGYTAAFLHYCTSDAHTGNRRANRSKAKSDLTWSWHFQGRRVVHALVEDLVKRGLGSEANHQLVFGGASAGGRGAMNTIDHLPEILAKAGAKHPVEVVGLFDAGLYTTRPAPLAGGTSFLNQTRQAFDLANMSGQVSGDCVQSYPEEEYKCLFPEHRLPFVKTKYILSHNGYDRYAGIVNLKQFGPTFREKELAWYEQYHTDVLNFLSAVPAASEQNAVFSPGCFAHDITLSPMFWELQAYPGGRGNATNGVSFNQMLGKFLTHTEQPRLVVDRCAGFNCGCRSFIPKISLTMFSEEILESHGGEGEFY